MPQLYIDRVDTLSLEERHGVVRGLVRKVRCCFQPGEAPPDYSVLDLVLQDPEMPEFMSTPVEPRYFMLRLTRRSAALVDGDTGTVDVTLTYEHVHDGPNQFLLGEGSTGIIYSKGKASIVEKPTNFFYPYGDRTKPKTLITVAHTFAPAEFKTSKFTAIPGYPDTVFQAGEIHIPFPQENQTISGILYTGTPYAYARYVVGAINETTFLDMEPRTWLCTEARWEALYYDRERDDSLYKFEFEFQYNLDEWDPTVIFNDSRTGRPPADVKEGTNPDDNIPPIYRFRYSQPFEVQPTPPPVGPPQPPGFQVSSDQPAGYWQVPALKRVNFTNFFANFIDGSSLPIPVPPAP